MESCSNKFSKYFADKIAHIHSDLDTTVEEVPMKASEAPFSLVTWNDFQLLQPHKIIEL